MTAITDALQIALSQSGWLLFFACVGIVLLTWHALRLTGAAWRVVCAVLIPVNWQSLLTVALLSCLLCVFAGPAHDLLQDIEVRYLRPVYIGQYTADDETKIRLYEAEIRRHTTPPEFEIVKTETARTAERIGSTPLAIYEAAWLECGLNPFRVRDDHVAAGWIQFTRVGLRGLGVSLEQVIAACQRRDAALIMRLTDQYLTRKASRLPEGATLQNTIDLYLAVFAPAHVGAEPDRVVYAGFSNPAYYKNSGLDGWKVENGKIVRGEKDGKITAEEIHFCLERKKGLLLSR